MATWRYWRTAVFGAVVFGVALALHAGAGLASLLGVASGMYLTLGLVDAAQYGWKHAVIATGTLIGLTAGLIYLTLTL
jgi:hypothetical protein